MTTLRARPRPDQVVPPGFDGSLPEWLCYRELIRSGRRDGEDFSFQTARLGGRQNRGGMVIDFIFQNPPGLAINVQGVYFHYEQGIATKNIDRVVRAMLAGSGITLIFIDEDALYIDARYYVQEALRFIDHSRLGRP